ncbi:DUF1707 SHOCT-like domain-containing protein [Kribbella shirazensis]|uniref:DUF1707 domain-containing protein n=1 Tax=Kribbella shirazensis TaxID=1105143 RepID=A0A7X5VA99_9ACTN|nr:DUF1707 domain-containing protein [Kribbella shirazensis]NIK56812.1 hypothetical protein [Kribbella shirazensis]
MSSPDHAHRDNARRRARQAWDRAGWNGPAWNGSDWNGRGWYNGSADQRGSAGRESWGGNWGEAGPNTPRDRKQDSAGRSDSAASSGRNDVPRKRVRIGDAERDRAVSLLSEHFVAGRLTQGEFEERSEQVTRARYSDDIEPLFDDLPAAAEVQVAQPSAPVGVRRAGPPPPFLMIAPFLMIGLVVSSIALTAPWLLWGLFWIVLLSGMGRHHGPRFHR